MSAGSRLALRGLTGVTVRHVTGFPLIGPDTAGTLWPRAELYMGLRTVEAHLSAVYRKLGIRSRSELARAWAQQPSAGG
jgi:Bacterial regulatory proteins, luxR family